MTTDERPESNVPIRKDLLDLISALKWESHEISQKYRIHALLHEAVGERMKDQRVNQ